MQVSESSARVALFACGAERAARTRAGRIQGVTPVTRRQPEPALPTSSDSATWKGSGDGGARGLPAEEGLEPVTHHGPLLPRKLPALQLQLRLEPTALLRTGRLRQGGFELEDLGL